MGGGSDHPTLCLWLQPRSRRCSPRREEGRLGQAWPLTSGLSQSLREAPSPGQRLSLCDPGGAGKQPGYRSGSPKHSSGGMTDLGRVHPAP